MAKIYLRHYTRVLKYIMVFFRVLVRWQKYIYATVLEYCLVVFRILKIKYIYMEGTVWYCILVNGKNIFTPKI